MDGFGPEGGLIEEAKRREAEDALEGGAHIPERVGARLGYPEDLFDALGHLVEQVLAFPERRFGPAAAGSLFRKGLGHLVEGALQPSDLAGPIGWSAPNRGIPL